METKHSIYLLLVFLMLAGITIWSCSRKEVVKVLPPPTEVRHLDWTRDMVIYEVNIRQYSKEGTFKGFQKDLPRLKAMGIDLIWLMPVNPIGIKNHKGKLGSYYSVKDYTAINPEYGKMADFKDLVKATHEQGMRIIIDWVPNHSSWDNALTKTHPEYYLHDSTGNFVSAFDWTDVIRFDYSKPEMRKWMTETMVWWYKETGIDGFRCDVAHMVPVDYWDALRSTLDSIKPVFMLAEADQPFLHKKAYDASYDWKFFHIMNSIAAGKMKASEVAKHFAWVDSVYPGDSYLMQFTSNHDENSWNGTEYERLGEGAKTFAVLAGTLPDMLLIYNGQESGFNRRLKFFEKDSIDWLDYPLTSFYKTLIDLKKQNTALFNGNGGRPVFLKTGQDSSVVAFIRQKENNKVMVICNLTAREKSIKIKDSQVEGTYTDAFTREKKVFEKPVKMKLKPWEFMVLEQH
jgi:glycosidase